MQQHTLGLALLIILGGAGFAPRYEVLTSMIELASTSLGLRVCRPRSVAVGCGKIPQLRYAAVCLRSTQLSSFRLPQFSVPFSELDLSKLEGISRQAQIAHTIELQMHALYHCIGRADYVFYDVAVRLR
jgi:hypothetical protein